MWQQVQLVQRDHHHSSIPHRSAYVTHATLTVCEPGMNSALRLRKTFVVTASIQDERKHCAALC
jgi:hypothetical protein